MVLSCNEDDARKAKKNMTVSILNIQDLKALWSYSVKKTESKIRISREVNFRGDWTWYMVTRKEKKNQVQKKAKRGDRWQKSLRDRKTKGWKQTTSNGSTHFPLQLVQTGQIGPFIAQRDLLNTTVCLRIMVGFSRFPHVYHRCERSMKFIYSKSADSNTSVGESEVIG